MDQLNGRTAVVTGGGSGIGRSLCLLFADEGANVVVSDIEGQRAKEVAAEVEAKGVRAMPVQVDVSKQDSVTALADAAYGEFGEVNVLCNNAGILQMGPVCEASQDDWDWLFAVNLWGVVNGVRTFVPRMRAQSGPAHIVNTASLSGVFAVPGLGVYTAAKYGVMALSETMLMELKPDDIGVSVLCPGPTRTQIGQTARMRMEPGGTQLNREEMDLTYLSYREPEQVAQCVIDAIKANRFYVFSHANGRVTTEKRFQHMLDDFSAAP